MIFWTFLLPFLLLSCQQRSFWREASIPNSNPHYAMAKLFYPISLPYKGILLEFIRHHLEINAYLSVYAFEIPPFQSNPQKAEVIFKAGQKTLSFIIDRLEGGQRLHLSKVALNKLLNLLKNYSVVKIEIGHYSQILISKTFEKKYIKFCSLPRWPLPEKMITFELY